MKSKTFFGQVGSLSLVVAIYSNCFSYTTLNEARDLTKSYQQYGIPPLNKKEELLLKELKNNPDKLQSWINCNVTYTSDEKQFEGLLCENNHPSCDVWASLGYLIRTKREDCDGVLAISHYILNKSGVGLYLEENKKNGEAHAVYLFQGENKLYGIISINDFEYKSSQFNSIDEAVQSFSDQYKSYRILILPDDDNKLIYYFNIKELVSIGPQIYFNDNREQL